MCGGVGGAGWPFHGGDWETEPLRLTEAPSSSDLGRGPRSRPALLPHTHRPGPSGRGGGPASTVR